MAVPKISSKLEKASLYGASATQGNRDSGPLGEAYSSLLCKAEFEFLLG